jgi:hypothetical protein
MPCPAMTPLTKGDEMKKFTKRNVQCIPVWRCFRKIRLTKAIRINGSFKVETREGTLECKDGYLALDSGGWPYPIDKEEFENIYVYCP